MSKDEDRKMTAGEWRLSDDQIAVELVSKSWTGRERQI